MRRLWAVLALACALVACNGQKRSSDDERTKETPDRKKKSKRKRKAEPVLLPEVREVGKALEMKHAVAFSNGTRAVRVLLSTQPLPCEPKELLTLLFEPRALERQVKMVLAPEFGPGGEDGPWHVAWLAPEGNVSQALGVRTKVYDVSGDVDGMFEATVDATAFGGSKGEHEKEIIVTGKLRAKGCGVIKPPSSPRPRPQSDLEVTIQGSEVAIVGARLDPLFNGGRELILSTEPLDDDCQLLARRDRRNQSQQVSATATR